MIYTLRNINIFKFGLKVGVQRLRLNCVEDGRKIAADQQRAEAAERRQPAHPLAHNT